MKDILSPRALLQLQISSNAPVPYLRDGFYATSSWQFIQAVVTTAAQARRRRRGLFGPFLPIEVHFRFQRVNELCVSHRAVLPQGDVPGCHCSSHEVVPPNDRSVRVGE